jgi:diaminopimelate epimerase
MFFIEDEMKFTKMQGAGNDFVMLKPERNEANWPELAQKMCNRHFGIGADGIILALPSKVADVRMRIFNPDGSEAETCGNGLRCLAKYAVINQLIKPGTTKITVETIPGVRNIKLEYRGQELDRIQVGIGVPRFDAKDIPVKIDLIKLHGPIVDYPLFVEGNALSINFISMGNPHAVCFIEQELKGFDLRAVGPKVENNSIFPRRINFEIARVRNRKTIEMRVWERGAGETLACGTGACAVAVAAIIHDYTDHQVDIILPGGTLIIEWDGKGEVLMSGPAEVVFSGDWPQ